MMNTLPSTRWSLRRILRACGRVYLVTSAVLITVQLLLVVWFFLGMPGYLSGPPLRQAQSGEAVQQATTTPATTAPSPTTVVLVGTIHGRHATNKQYSAKDLRDVIKDVHPDLILIEAPRTTAWEPALRAACLWPDAAWNADYPEGWACASAASDLGVPLLPFDWSERDEFFRRERYFEREQDPKLGQAIDTWAANGTPSERRKTLVNMMRGSDEYDAFQTISSQGSAWEMNSASRDELERYRHALSYGVVPDQMARVPELQHAASELHWFGEVWRRRNRAMADNILSDIAKYKARRIVVVTGATHRYILRDLLKTSPQVDLQEFYDVASNDEPDGQASQGGQVPTTH